MKRMKGRHLAFLGILLGLINVGIPYLFLRDVSSFWGSFLFWILVTVGVLSVGLWKIRQW